MPLPRIIAPALALAVSLATAPGAEPVTLTLADFTDTNGAAPSGGWSETDGVIRLSGKGGNLITKTQYENFTLEWEWKVGPKGNNGVKYWVTNVGGREWLGIEYQMIDDSGHPDGQRGGSHTTASIYDIKAPIQEKGLKPAGEWNQSKIVVRDGKIQHWLNGILAVEADTRSDEWPKLIAGSKFRDKQGFAPGKGHIMLTDHSDETWFRKIRVTAE